MVAKHLSLLALALLQHADALLVGAAGVHLRRASIHSMYMKDSSDAALNSGEACHLLSDTQRGAIHDMVASDENDMGNPRNKIIDSIYVECDQPSEDPNMTCAHAASLLLYLGSSPFFFLTRF